MRSGSVPCATVSADIPDVAGVEHRFVDADGVRTHVALAGDGPPVLLLHGWPQHWYLWRDVIPLAAPHARLIAPDFRGFGWTDAPRDGYRRDQLKRDILALVDDLGVAEFSIAGHDWGGYVGFLLALDHPERVRSFLALNVLPPWRSRDLRAALDAWRFLYMPLLAAPLLGRRIGRAVAARGLRDSGLGPDAVEAFVSRLGRATEPLYRSFLGELPALLRGRYSAAGLRVPTRLVFGTHDPVLTTRAAKDAAAQADAMELELVPDAGHFVVDEKPELVADRLLALLRA
jgi:pimeloyl-ACP methyl ester carboxylesterase